MGDLKKKKSDFATAAAERESRTVQDKKTVKRIVKGASIQTGKSQMISAKVYPDVWTKFQRICRAQGLTANSVLNSLIIQYARDNEFLLDD